MERKQVSQESSPLRIQTAQEALEAQDISICPECNQEVAIVDKAEYFGNDCEDGVVIFRSLPSVHPMLVLTISAVFGGLGNSLEPVTALSVLNIYLLIIGFNYYVHLKSNWLSSIRNSLMLGSFICITQGLGFCLGFSSIFGYPHTTFGSILMCFGAGIAVWLMVCLFALWPYYWFLLRFPSSFATTLVFPTGFTMVYHVLVGNLFSTFPSFGNSVLDFAPLRQVATLFGIASVTFVVSYVTNFVAILHRLNLRQQRNKLQNSISKHLFCLVFSLFVLFTITGFIVQGNAFYQVNVSHQIVPSIPVSCLFGQNAEVGSLSRSQLWNMTEQRAELGDKIILWSEESFLIESTEDENDVLSQAQAIASQYGTYIGVSYMLQLSGEKLATNQFALIASNGEIAWNYLKANPVPGVENNVKAGPNKIPIYESEYGKMAGAICFDMDFPRYIRQAGVQKADIMLQPSWTWNAISSRHFNGDAVRAIENGFTVMRCSSMGESGIVSANGEIKARTHTGHDPLTPALYQLPLQTRQSTMYTAIGFIFEWVVLIACVVYYLLALLPKDLVFKFLIEIEKVSGNFGCGNANARNI